MCPIKGKSNIKSGSYVTFIECGTNSSYLTAKNTPIFDYLTPFDYHISTENNIIETTKKVNEEKKN